MDTHTMDMSSDVQQKFFCMQTASCHCISSSCSSPSPTEWYIIENPCHQSATAVIATPFHNVCLISNWILSNSLPSIVRIKRPSVLHVFFLWKQLGILLYLWSKGVLKLLWDMLTMLYEAETQIPHRVAQRYLPSFSLNINHSEVLRSMQTSSHLWENYCFLFLLEYSGYVFSAGARRVLLLLLILAESAVSGRRVVLKKPDSGTVSLFKQVSDYDMVFPSQGKCSADVPLFLKRLNGLESTCPDAFGCLVLYGQWVVPSPPVSFRVSTSGYNLLSRGSFSFRSCFYMLRLRGISV